MVAGGRNRTSCPGGTAFTAQRRDHPALLAPAVNFGGNLARLGYRPARGRLTSSKRHAQSPQERSHMLLLCLFSTPRCTSAPTFNSPSSEPRFGVEPNHHPYQGRAQTAVRGELAERREIESHTLRCAGFSKPAPAPTGLRAPYGGERRCRPPGLSASSRFERMPGAVQVHSPWLAESGGIRNPCRKGTSRVQTGGRNRPASLSMLADSKRVELSTP